MPLTMIPLLLSGLAGFTTWVAPIQTVPPVSVHPHLVWESQAVEANRASSFLLEFERNWRSERLLAASA